MSENKLKLVSLTALGRKAVCLYGLDEDGQVWQKIGEQCWEKISMETNCCPSCLRSQSNPERIVKADGHGRLNKYCSDEFHKN